MYTIDFLLLLATSSNIRCSHYLHDFWGAAIILQYGRHQQLMCSGQFLYDLGHPYCDELGAPSMKVLACIATLRSIRASIMTSAPVGIVPDRSGALPAATADTGSIRSLALRPSWSSSWAVIAIALLLSPRAPLLVCAGRGCGSTQQQNEGHKGPQFIFEDIRFGSVPYVQD